MKFVKKLLAGVAVAAAMASSAYASPITVAGVTWDPATPADVFSNVTERQWFDTTTGNLTGVGLLTDFNGLSLAGTNTVIPSGQITFEFGGISINPLNGAATGGWLNLYVSPVASLDLTNNVKSNSNAAAKAAAITAASSGTLFLSLSSNTDYFASNATGNNPSFSSGTMTTYWNVTGGAAASNFNTNAQYNGADLYSDITASFSKGNLALVGTGTGSIYASTVPEPESLALVGLGLLGLVASRRRKTA